MLTSAARRTVHAMRPIDKLAAAADHVVVHPHRSACALLAAAAMALGVPSTALASNGWSGPAGIDGANSLVSVSCPSASFCVAVDNAGNALTYSGSSWSAPTDIDGATPLVSVSCASASFCAAVDGANDALTYNGITWSAPTNIDGATNKLTSVSCASASFCAAVTTGGSGTDASALTYNGSSWSLPDYTDFNLKVDAFGSVSCPSASFCVAVGTDYSGSFGLAAWIYNGSSWSAMTVNDPGTDSAYVSCPSASFCAAVDSAGNALTYNGGSWSAPTNVNGPNQLESVSCASASFCVAADNTHALTYSGGSWSAPASIDSTGYALHSVSCPSASFCVAVDGAGNAYTYPESTPPTTTTTTTTTATTTTAPPASPQRPVLSALRAMPRVVSLAGKAHGKRRAKVLYTDVTYTDSEAATTTLTVLQSRPGVKRGHGCAAAPRRRPKGVKLKRCTRTMALGHFVMHDSAGETMRLRFHGRVGGHLLKPGHYTVRAVASLAGLTSAPVQTGFRIP